MVAQADTMLVAIRKKVRRLVGSPNTSQLSNDDLDEYINTYYSLDFPSSCKLDQLRVDYQVFTSPNVDTYTVDLNQYQGLRAPVYFEGVEGTLYKDRSSFYRKWSKLTSKLIPATGDGTTLAFSFTINGAPFVPGSINLSTIETGGSTIKVQDDSSGNLLQGSTTIGAINYVTGVVTITFVVAPGTSEDIIVWADQYQASRPRDVLFWNNTLTVRPIPDGVYRMEIEAFLTPTQFMATNESPTLNQWYQLIALGAAVKVLQDRQDMEGLENILPFFEEQKGLVLERQAIDGIGVRTGTIYAGGDQGPSGSSWGGY